jgi:hypothetical protein
MSKVPTLRVVSKDRAPQLPDLPEEVRLALNEAALALLRVTKNAAGHPSRQSIDEDATRPPSGDTLHLAHPHSAQPEQDRRTVLTHSWPLRCRLESTVSIEGPRAISPQPPRSQNRVLPPQAPSTSKSPYGTCAGTAGLVAQAVSLRPRGNHQSLVGSWSRRINKRFRDARRDR